MFSRALLFLKGMAMGIADVIPGVSGGTLALILGVYKELLDSIKGLSPKILVLVWRWLAGGRNADAWTEILDEFQRLNITFLVTLGAGIATALVVGSMTIPTLMENFPVAMRALFFGLIVASVFVPFRMIEFKTPKEVSVVALCALGGLLFGFLVTDPSHVFEPSQEVISVEAREAETLKELTRRGPSALSSEQVYWASGNDALRAAIAGADPAKAAEFEALHAAAQSPTRDKKVLKARSKPYDDVLVPVGTPVNVPRPAPWFVFVAGMIAICAMILPGISGSYILLILDVYFFILNALKGFLTTLAHGALPLSQGLYVILFCMGCAIGLLGFARVLSFLLKRYTSQTLGVLVGLMVGCLRGIWPFRETVAGVDANVIPTAFDGSVMMALIAALAGFAIVATFTWIGRVRSEGHAVHDA